MPKKTVVVTGGSRGIGRAICLAFASSDTTIYFNYASSLASATETINLIADAGGKAIGIQANVACEKEVESFFKKIIDETGQIDILVNNAGIVRDGLLIRMKFSDWDDVLETNLTGTFLCTKIAARAMIKKRFGRIINIASFVGSTGNAGQANYAASKAGIIGFTKAIARELAPRNITVNAVAPGYIETDMTATLSDKVKDTMIDQIPLGRVGKPEDVAAVVEFLASEKAGYITGQVIHVSGGIYI